MTAAEFGATVWGKAWLRTVAPTAAAGPNALLPKARSLARNDAATLTVRSGLIEARVVVAGVTSQVRITIPPWTASQRSEVVKLLAENPAPAAGDLPDALELELWHRKINVNVPLAELDAECDCTSKRRPCVHVLTAVHRLVQLVDERPRLAVELRGVGVTEEAADLTTAHDPDRVRLSDLDPATFYDPR